jgi:phosphoribosylanthranilate isomerase
MGHLIAPRVKICGITRLADAEAAVDLGAHALGFVFWPSSPRAVGREVARTIAAALPALVTRVGVFVNMSPAEVADTVNLVGLDVVQLHGDEDVHAYAGVGVRLMKVVRLADEAAVDRAAELPPSVTPLVDAIDDARRGGTGRRANWALAARLASRRPIVLAGGLSGETVGEALRAVRPWGIDVSSGVEQSPGVKSQERLRALFAAVARTEGA